MSRHDILPLLALLVGTTSMMILLVLLGGAGQ